jgi:peptidoglycan/LPS O-acetylase OafA/YrhL
MERLSRLDGMRGVLAVYVMVCHGCSYAVLPAPVAAVFNHGEAAVDLFFALSGMVVINSLKRFNYRFWPFLRGRARRLLPVYFAVLALAILLAWLGSPLPAMPWLSPDSMAGSFWRNPVPATYFFHILEHVFLVHGLIPQGLSPWAWIDVLGPAWSLSTEWQFYILTALVMARLKSRQRLAWFAYLMLGLGLFYHAAAPFLPAPWQFSRAFLPDAAPYFALGLASAAWLRGGKAVPFGICLAAVFALGLVSGVPGKAAICLVWAVLLLAQLYPGMKLLPGLLDSRAAQYLGAISYPLYLINEPVQRACAMLLAPYAHGSAVSFTYLWLPAALILPIPAAAALHVWIELPFLRAGVLKVKTLPLRPGPESGRRIFTR